MRTTYSIEVRQGAIVLKVNDLGQEFRNKEILQSLNAKIEHEFPNFVVDLSGMQVMNSIGLNFLINLKKQSDAFGSGIAIVGASVQVQRLLDITKLQHYFKLTNTVEDALQTFSAYEH